MLAVHPAGQDFHHAFIRDRHSGDEGPFYQSLHDASDENTGSRCYILASRTDPTWFVVCGRSPSGIGEADLAEWLADLTIRGRIDKDAVR